jgi:hypothetical protein
MAASKEFPIPHENEKSQPKANAKHQTTATDLTVPTKEETAISEQERLANCYMDASLQVEMKHLNELKKIIHFSLYFLLSPIVEALTG